MDQLPRTHDIQSRQANWGCCNRHNLDPRNWELSPKKVAIAAAAVLGICALALTACIMIVQYPAASSAFITTFSTIGIVSFLTLCIALVKQCQNRKASDPPLMHQWQ